MPGFPAAVPGLMAGLLVLAACAREPYIHNPAEFDRDSPGFAKQLEDRVGLEICYARQTTTVQDLLAMAEAECGRFAKEARFLKQDNLICPILTPARASFACVSR